MSDHAPVSIPFSIDVFNLDIVTLSIGRLNNRFYIQMSAILNFEQNQGAGFSVLNGILPQNIAISRLRVWDNGKIAEAEQQEGCAHQQAKEGFPGHKRTHIVEEDHKAD